MSIIKRINSFRYAIAGIRKAFATELNLWIQLGFACIVVMLGYYFGISRYEWIALIFACGFVLVCELFNTAVEKLVDLVSPQHDERAGKIKDIAAGAVLLSAVTAAVTGLIIFVPYLNLL